MNIRPAGAATLLGVVAILGACGAPHSPADAGTCLDASIDYGPFTACQLAAQATVVVYGRFQGLGTPVPVFDAIRNCERNYDDVVLSVSRTLKGGVDAGTLDYETDPLNEQGPLDTATSQDGLFFLWPYGNGHLGIAPTGGFFWLTDGGWVNIARYAGAPLTTADLEARIANPDGGLCAGGFP
jgi:hypothetical protein